MYASLRLGSRALMGRKRRLFLLSLLVAVGIAGMVAVRSTVGDLTRQVEEQARALLGADLELRVPADPPEELAEALAAVEQAGGAVQPVTVVPAVASAGSREALIEVRAVDPSRYPWYGQIELESGAALNQALRADEVVVAADLAEQLDLRPGSPLTLLGRTYTVAALIERDPTVASKPPFAGPTVLVDRSGFEPPARGADERLFVKLPPGEEAESLRLRLEEALGEDRVRRYDEAAADLQRTLALTARALTLIAFSAIFLGALGVASNVRAFLAEETEEIAVWKALGCSTGEVAAYYAVQIAVAGTLGSLVGAGAGIGARSLVLALFREQLPAATEALPLGAEPVLVGLLFGPVIALLAAVPDLATLTAIHPHLALRAGERPAGRGARMLVAGLAVVAAALGLVAALTGSLRLSAAFLAVLTAAAMSLFVISLFTLWLLTRVPGGWLPWFVAKRNLRRPSAPVAVVALSLGTFLLSGLGLLRDGLVADLQRTGGSALTPNLYLLQVPAETRHDLQRYLDQREEVIWTLPSFAMANGQVTTAGGDRRSALLVEQNQLMRHEIVAGRDLTPNDLGRPHLLLRNREAAAWGLEPGDSVTVTVGGEERTFTVVGIFDPAQGLRIDAPVVLPTGAIDTAGTYILPLRVQSGAVAALQSDLLSRYPGMLPVSLDDVLNMAREVVDQAALLLRGVSLLALAAGAVAVAGAVVASHLERRRDAALFKVLGVSWAQVLTMQSLEGLVQGAGAGLAGGLLALLSFGIIVRILTGQGLPAHLIWQTLLIWPALTGAISLLSSQLALWGIRREPVLLTLRGQ